MTIYESFRVHFRPVSPGPLVTLEVPAAPINVFVGPNGSGKSTAIRELSGGTDTTRIACGLRYKSDIVIHHFNNFLSDRPRVFPDPYREFAERIIQNPSEYTFDYGSQQPPNYRSVSRGLRDFEQQQRLVLSVTDSIVQIKDGPLTRFRDQPQSRLDLLWRDKATLEKFRSRIFEMFALYPVIQAHVNLQLRLSRVTPPEGIEAMRTTDSEEFMESAEQIHQISDGTRTYVGLWGHIYSGNERLLFLDEAGAFLHPPLARKLGKQLTQLAAERRGHVFAATHSPDFVLGCIQAGHPANVIRLTYRNEVSTARLLSADDLLPLMRDPLLRSANILSGLFHEGVVVCEADADRAFYQEINERLLDVGEGVESCHFVNAQNWQTIPRIATALRRLGIPAALLVDLDAVIHKDTPKLLTAAGIPETVAHSLGQLRGDLNTRISDRTRLKRDGLAIVPVDQREGWNYYLRTLAEYGIFVVPVGELEGWFPDLGVPRPASGESKGEWITQIFARMGSDATSPEYIRPAGDGPWAFVREITRWLADPQRRGLSEISTNPCAGSHD